MTVAIFCDEVRNHVSSWVITRIWDQWIRLIWCSLIHRSRKLPFWWKNLLPPPKHYKAELPHPIQKGQSLAQTQPCKLQTDIDWKNAGKASQARAAMSSRLSHLFTCLEDISPRAYHQHQGNNPKGHCKVCCSHNDKMVRRSTEKLFLCRMKFSFVSFHALKFKKKKILIIIYISITLGLDTSSD